MGATGEGGQVDQRTALSRLLVDVARRVGSTLELRGTLEQVTQAVVDLLGFEIAVLNLKDPDRDCLEVVAVAGSAPARAELLGSRVPLADWEAVLGASKPIGALRFADHSVAWPDDLPFSLPEMAVLEHTDAWHPEDALFAPLHGGDGRLLGVLSVDVPTDGLRPDAQRCELLELFAVQASLAIEHARLHEELQKAHVLLELTFQHSPVAMALFDQDRRYAQVNPAYLALLGRTEEQVLGHRVSEFSHPEDAALTDRASARVRGGVHIADGIDKRYLRPDGTVVWGRLSLTWLPTAGGERVLAHVEDVTLSRAAVAVLEQRASTDPLTGLANRDRFDAVVTERLERGGAQVAVLFCDVDRFKAVNDTLGHAAGDALLQRIAGAVTGVLRSGDLAARLGGDEFVLLLDGVDDEAHALRIAERVRVAAGQVVRTGGRELTSTMTVGVALSGPGSTSRSLLADADAALYDAKQAGRDRVALAARS